MSLVTDFGDQMARGATYVEKNFVAPDYVTWWVIPFVVTLLISAIITFFILRSMSSSVQNACLVFVGEEDIEDIKDSKKCKSAGFSWWVYLIAVIVAPVILGLIVAAGSYKIGVYTHNPKVAAGIMTTEYVTEALK
jgi:hypothetical protein